MLCPLRIYSGRSSKKSTLARLPSSSTKTAATSNCHGVSDETFLPWRYVWIIRPKRSTFWLVMWSSGRNLSLRIFERMYVTALSCDVSCVTSRTFLVTVPASDLTSMKWILPRLRATTSSSPHCLLKFRSRIVYPLFTRNISTKSSPIFPSSPRCMFQLKQF